MRGLLLSLLLVGLLSACAGGRQGPPEWLRGEPAAYPGERYLIGRGQGPGLELAQDRARAELAKAFRVRIQADSRDLTRYRSEQGGGELQRHLERSVAREVRTFTDQVVEGVEIVDVWHDRRRDLFYALAVLERKPAAQRLRRALQQLDRRVEIALEHARSADPLARVRAWYAAQKALLTRSGLASALGVVTARRPPTPSLEAGAVQQGLMTALAELRLAVSADPAMLQGAAGDALTALGVSRGAGGYRLRITLEVTPVGHQSGWYWVRALLGLTLEDARGRVQAERRVPLKAAALDADQAEARLRTQAASEVRRVVAGMILGEGRLPGEAVDR